MHFWLLKSFLSYRKASTSWISSTMYWSFFLVSFCTLSLTTLAQASELQIEIVDSWVEEGYIFHVDFQVPPYNVNCATTGAGFIAFNVYYKDPQSLQGDWTFGLAPWPGGSAHDSNVESHLTAYGPQGFCTKFSPCIIQNIEIIQAWCPPLEGESFYAQ